MLQSVRSRGTMLRSDLRRARPVSLIGILGLLAGCYTYVPINAETVAPPLRVRAYLSPEAAERVAPVVGGVHSAVDGRLVEAAGRSFYLEVTSAYVQQGMRTETLSQRLLLAPEDIVSLQRRELDRTRTYLLAGAGAAAVGALIYTAVSGEAGGSTTQPPSGGGSEVRNPLPLLSIPLP